MFATGETVGLAEWIILFYVFVLRKSEEKQMQSGVSC